MSSELSHLDSLKGIENFDVALLAYCKAMNTAKAAKNGNQIYKSFLKDFGYEVTYTSLKYCRRRLELKSEQIDWSFDITKGAIEKVIYDTED